MTHARLRAAATLGLLIALMGSPTRARAGDPPKTEIDARKQTLQRVLALMRSAERRRSMRPVRGGPLHTGTPPPWAAATTDTATVSGRDLYRRLHPSLMEQRERQPDPSARGSRPAATPTRGKSDPELRELWHVLDWTTRLQANVSANFKRLDSAAPAARMAILERIRQDLNLSEELSCSVLGCVPVKLPSPQLPTSPDVTPARLRAIVDAAESALARETQSGPAAGSPSDKPRLKRVTGFASSILHEIGLHPERLDYLGQQRDFFVRLGAARKAWGTGRAGGGGVSLHLPATIQGIDASQVKAAKFDGERIVLELADGKRVAMPKFPLDDLAVAVRSIYGPRALIEGRRDAWDGKVIVFETGAERFGQVVWRADYLPQPPKLAKPGETVRLPIAPAVGISPLPEPSRARVTFYGDLANTSLGSVLLRSDQLLGQLLKGVDPETGKFLALPRGKGLTTYLEEQARTAQAGTQGAPDDAETPRAEPWWQRATWFVFVPASIVLERTQGADELRVKEVKLRLDAWSSKGAAEASRKFAEGVTKNLAVLRKAYSVLDDLHGIAVTVGTVRWLRLHGIPCDVDWALKRNVARVPTPDTFGSVEVFTAKGRDGKPILRPHGRRRLGW